MGRRVLHELTEVICPWCHEKSTVKEWDDNTYKCCTSREMRRLYLSIKEVKAFYKGSGKYYKCPKCNMWSEGCNLRMDTCDPELIRLGGSLRYKVGVSG